MRLDHARRAVVRNLLSAAALTVAPSLPASADAPPTYSLKGLAGALTGADAPRPADQLGVIGRGQNRDKSGRLNSCPADKKGCISTFSQFDEESYVPPWTYQSDFSTQATSPNDARRAALRAEVGAAAVEAGETKPAPKSREVAERELRAAIEAAAGRIVETGDRYLYAEFEAGGGTVDDVEFLFSLDTPIVGYRSAPRRGADDKRQRNRIKELRKALKEDGWKSVGRIVE